MSAGIEREEPLRDAAPEWAKESAQQCHAHYEVSFESTALPDHTIRNVGYRLELYGRVGPDGKVRPGDDRCREVFHTLESLARLVVPGAESARLCTIRCSPGALYYCGPGGKQACVRLEIRVMGSEGCDRPIDAQAAHALREMEERLRALGMPRA
jgi:hypothetical protein